MLARKEMESIQSLRGCREDAAASIHEGETKGECNEEFFFHMRSCDDASHLRESWFHKDRRYPITLRRTFIPDCIRLFKHSVWIYAAILPILPGVFQRKGR